MYQGLHSYRGSARFTTWLFRIAYHTFLNDQRGKQTSDEFDEDVHGSVADTSADLSVAIDVDRALERLSVRQRAVFDLHYKKGMTHSEIAEALELPLGTIKSDLVRGHEKLKELLSGANNERTMIRSRQRCGRPNAHWPMTISARMCWRGCRRSVAVRQRGAGRLPAARLWAARSRWPSLHPSKRLSNRSRLGAFHRSCSRPLQSS